MINFSETLLGYPPKYDFKSDQNLIKTEPEID